MKQTKEKKQIIRLLMVVAILITSILVVSPIQNVEAAKKTKTVTLKAGQSYHFSGKMIVTSKSKNAKYSVITCGKKFSMKQNKKPASSGDSYKKLGSGSRYITCEKGKIKLKIYKNGYEKYGSKAKRKKLTIKKGKTYRVWGAAVAVTGNGGKYSYICRRMEDVCNWSLVENKKSTKKGKLLYENGTSAYGLKEHYITAKKKSLTVWIYGDTDSGTVPKFNTIEYEKCDKLFDTYILQPNKTYNIQYNVDDYTVTQNDVYFKATAGTVLKYSYTANYSSTDGEYKFTGNINFNTNSATLCYTNIYQDYDSVTEKITYMGSEWKTLNLKQKKYNGSKVYVNPFKGERIERALYEDGSNSRYELPIAIDSAITVSANRAIKLIVPTFYNWRIQETTAASGSNDEPLSMIVDTCGVFNNGYYYVNSDVGDTWSIKHDGLGISGTYHYSRELNAKERDNWGHGGKGYKGTLDNPGEEMEESSFWSHDAGCFSIDLPDDIAAGQYVYYIYQIIDSQYIEFAIEFEVTDSGNGNKIIKNLRVK